MIAWYTRKAHVIKMQLPLVGPEMHTLSRGGMRICQKLRLAEVDNSPQNITDEIMYTSGEVGGRGGSL